MSVSLSMVFAVCGMRIVFLNRTSSRVVRSCNLRQLHSDGNKKHVFGSSGSSSYVEVLPDDAFFGGEGDREERMQTLLPPSCGSGIDAAELCPATVHWAGHQLSGQDGRGSGSSSSTENFSHNERRSLSRHAQNKEGSGNALYLCPVCRVVKKFAEVEWQNAAASMSARCCGQNRIF